MMFELFYLFGLLHEPPLIATFIVLLPAVAHVGGFGAIYEKKHKCLSRSNGILNSYTSHVEAYSPCL